MGRTLLGLCLLLLAASPARAEWRRATTAHFVIYSESAPDELRVFAEKLERFDGLLRMMSPVPPEQEGARRLTIFMLANQAAVADLAGSYSVAGFYNGSVAGPFAVAPRRMDDPRIADAILFHEYAHHFMLQNYSTLYPGWFVEGYAELFSTVRFDPDGAIRVGEVPEHRRVDLTWRPISLRRMMFANPRDFRPEEGWTFYAQAWQFTHFLTFAEGREGQLRRYIALLADGVAPEQAAEQAFAGFAALEREFGRYRQSSRRPYIRISFEQAPPTPAVAIEAVGAGEQAILRERLRYMNGPPRGGGTADLARDVRSRAAAAPNDPAVLQMLADAEHLAANDDAATRAVDALLALQPQSSRALLRKGLIELDRLKPAGITSAEAWTAARRWVARANRADPNDPLPLYEYYMSFIRQGVPPPEAAAQGLMRAFQLAPQDRRVRMQLVRQLIDERRYSEAVIVLAPIAYSAHESPARDEARRLMERIRALEDGAALPPETPAPAPAATK